MMSRDDILERWIPYRLQAIDTFQFAWSWLRESDNPRDVLVVEGGHWKLDGTVESVVGGHLKLRGNVASIANPMIEAGVIHARALLEFLGLRAHNGRLAQVTKRYPGDIAVEHLSTSQFPLQRLDPEHALAAYSGPIEEAEDALISIFEVANKLMAHITDGAFSGEWTDRHLDTACRGIPALIESHLYTKLGMAVPKAVEAIPPERL